MARTATPTKTNAPGPVTGSPTAPPGVGLLVTEAVVDGIGDVLVLGLVEVDGLVLVLGVADGLLLVLGEGLGDLLWFGWPQLCLQPPP